MPRKRYLAPWHRDPEELDAMASADEEVAKALASLRGKPAIYHCVTRVVDRGFLLDREAREKTAALIRLYEDFCQIRVLTYCTMSNHVHFLLEVPAPPENGGGSWSDEKLLRHVSPLYTKEKNAELRWELDQLRAQKDGDGAEAFRRRFFDRLWDMGQFVKPLKQSISRWFNSRHGRRGTLWEERFKSVVVEEGHAARIMAAYIDMNPVRAELVEDPKDYRWCGYGEAMAGKEAARDGLRALTADLLEEADTPWRDIVRHYRDVLFTDEEQSGEGAMIHSRTRHFSDGLVFGSEDFVNRVFLLSRDFFGPKRKSGARKIRGINTELRAMRDLQ